MDLYFSQKQQFEVKNINDGFVPYKHMAFHFMRC